MQKKCINRNLILPTLVTVILLCGCASHYKNPENSNTQATFRAHESKPKQLSITQFWGISPNENCSVTGFALAAKLPLWEFLKTPGEQGLKEKSVNLKTDKRVFIGVQSVWGGGRVMGNEITNICRNNFSFIPYQNREYIIQQYFYGNDNERLQCGVKVIDKNTNAEPASLLNHEPCDWSYETVF